MPELQDWDEVKLRLHERFPGLSEAEIDETRGERGAVVALLEMRLGYGPQQAEQDLDRLLHQAA